MLSNSFLGYRYTWEWPDNQIPTLLPGEKKHPVSLAHSLLWRHTALSWRYTDFRPRHHTAHGIGGEEVGTSDETGVAQLLFRLLVVVAVVAFVVGGGGLGGRPTASGLSEQGGPAAYILSQQGGQVQVLGPALTVWSQKPSE